MPDDDKRRAASQSLELDACLASLTVNRRNFPMAPDPEPGEELPPQPIGLRTRRQKSKLPS